MTYYLNKVSGSSWIRTGLAPSIRIRVELAVSRPTTLARNYIGASKICRFLNVILMCRYLDSYEKHYFLGEEEEDEGGAYYDEEDSRVSCSFLKLNHALIESGSAYNRLFLNLDVGMH
jgi:hypothetical protein